MYVGWESDEAGIPEMPIGIFAEAFESPYGRTGDDGQR